jgi:hypothetical protein
MAVVVMMGVEPQKHNASKWLNRTDNASEQKSLQVIEPQKTLPQTDRIPKDNAPNRLNHKDSAPNGSHRKRGCPQWTALQKTRLWNKDRTAKAVPPADRTAKDTPPNRSNHKRHVSKGSKRKDNAPNGSSRECAISALATAQANLQPSTPLVKTECLGRQWASPCSGKHGFFPAPSIVFCRNVYLHLIGTMMGLLAAKPWE